MSHQSAALPIAFVVLRILIVLNFIWGICILALLGGTVFAHEWTLTALGITPEHAIRGVLLGLQGIAALGLVAIVLNYLILKRLIAMVETVRTGDPFVAANAYRLHAIAWIMVGMQLLSIAIAAIGRFISTPGFPVDLDAGFSINSWVAILLTFVLARVFAEGTLMREDLEGTV
jgi:hypothetical protein